MPNCNWGNALLRGRLEMGCGSSSPDKAAPDEEHKTPDLGGAGGIAPQTQSDATAEARTDDAKELLALNRIEALRVRDVKLVEPLLEEVHHIVFIARRSVLVKVRMNEAELDVINTRAHLDEYEELPARNNESDG